MIALPLSSPSVVADTLIGLKSRTAGTVGINFLIPFLDRDCVEAAAGHARIVEFFYGAPEVSLVELVHQGGALAPRGRSAQSSRPAWRSTPAATL